MADACLHCGREFAQHLDRCQHCHTDVGSPNVRAASDPREIEALNQLYLAAIADARRRGCESVLNRFERETASSRAVVCKKYLQLAGIIAPDYGSWVIPNYYQQIDGGARAPDDAKWDWQRAQERRWFPNYVHHINYGVLTLNDSGASGWGEVAPYSVNGRSKGGPLSANRMQSTSPSEFQMTSRFHQVIEHHGATAEDYVSPNFSASILCDTPVERFPEILLKQGDSKDDADFVEVHIYGTLTLESVARVRVPRKYEYQSAELWEKIRARNVIVEFVEDES